MCVFKRVEAQFYSFVLGQSQPVVLFNLMQSSNVTTCASLHITNMHVNTHRVVFT